MRLFRKKEQDGTKKPRRRMGCLGICLIGLAVYCCGLLINFLWGGNSQQYKLSDDSVYVLKMSGQVVERGNENDPMAQLIALYNDEDEVGLNTLINNIRLAKSDKHIRGIVLKGGSLGAAPASAKAIRDALVDFKQSGKFIIAYAEGYSTISYYIASAADKVYLNPVGSVAWHGYVASKMYFKRLLEKVGVEMQIVKVGTFKSERGTRYQHGTTQPVCRSVHRFSASRRLSDVGLGR